MNNIEIHKNDGVLETVLNVGMTDLNDIYIDIRVYRYGDVVDVGDITITQDDWNKINRKLNVAESESKLYRCPECGDIVTEADILESLSNGGYGMCMCKFGNGQRVLVQYEPYTKPEPEPELILTPSEIDVIRMIRAVFNEE